MTDWLHCNTCFRQPGEGIGFSLTNCGHIYCEKCVRVACNERCSMCGSVCDKITLSSKMKPEVETFFTNPLDLIKKDTKKSIQVMEFQHNHRRRFVEHQRKQIMKMEKYVKHLQQTLSQSQESESKLKEENAYLKRLLTEKGLGGHGRPLTPGKQFSPVSRGSPGFNFQGSGRAVRTSPVGRHCSPAFGNHMTQHSSITSGRLSVRTPPSGGKIGTIQGTPVSQSVTIPQTPQSVPHPISLSDWQLTPD